MGISDAGFFLDEENRRNASENILFCCIEWRCAWRMVDLFRVLKSKGNLWWFCEQLW